MTVNTKNVVPRTQKIRNEVFLECEVQRRILVEQTRALAKSLTGFQNTCAGAPGFAAGGNGRLDSRRIQAGKRHGLVLRDAAAFSQAAAEYARNAPWLQRAARAARSRKEWWIRRFRPWDLPGLRRSPLRRDRILAWTGTALLLLLCAGVGWWMSHAPPPQSSQPLGPAHGISSGDLASAKTEAERAGLAFLRARDSRERAIYLRPGPGGRRPVAPSFVEREWNSPRIAAHWAEPLDRGLTGHWLRVVEGAGERKCWVAVVTQPSTGGMGWTGQVDAEAMQAYQASPWNAFLDGTGAEERQIFRLLARTEAEPYTASGFRIDPSALILRLSDAKRERDCAVRLPRNHPAFSRWSAGDVALGSPDRERPVTVELERIRPDPGDAGAAAGVRLVSILADGWILP